VNTGLGIPNADTKLYNKYQLELRLTKLVLRDIIYHPVLFKTTHNILETGFCLHLLVDPTQFGPVDRHNPYLQTKRNVLF
jgi:hypothetical protein